MTHGLIRWGLLSVAATTVACNEISISGQGDDGDIYQLVTDSFEQEPVPSLDILFVIDNTKTMSDEGCALSYAWNQLILALDERSSPGPTQLSWQVGVLTTDMTTAATSPSSPEEVPGGSSGVLRGRVWAITPALEGWADLLLGNLQVGTAGVAANEGLLAATTALTPPLVDGANQGFLRPYADLAVVFVSDGNDDSRDAAGQVIPVQELADTLRLVKAGRGALSATAVVGPASTADLSEGDLSHCPESSAALIGERYIDLVGELGGEVIGLQGGKLPEELPTFLPQETSLRGTFVLSRAPDSAEIAVFVDEVRLTEGFTLEGVELRFDDPAVVPYGATLRVQYLVLAEEETP